MQVSIWIMRTVGSRIIRAVSFKTQHADQLLRTLHTRLWKISHNERDFGHFIVPKKVMRTQIRCAYAVVADRFERPWAVRLLPILRIVRRMHDSSIMMQSFS